MAREKTVGMTVWRLTYYIKKCCVLEVIGVYRRRLNILGRCNIDLKMLHVTPEVTNDCTD